MPRQVAHKKKKLPGAWPCRERSGVFRRGHAHRWQRMAGAAFAKNHDGLAQQPNGRPCWCRVLCTCMDGPACVFDGKRRGGHAF
jgi:hypothetical protein